MKKKNVIITAIIVAAFALTFTVGPLQAAKRRYVSIAAGWVTGAYFPMAGAISRIAWKHLKDEGIKVTAESSGASVANAKLIGAGDTDFAILQNDIASYAYNGKEGMFKNPIKELLGVCTLFPEHVQVVARKDSNIKSIADLKGKKVAIGPVGSGTMENTTQILEAWGLTVNDLGKAEQLTASQAADYLKNERLINCSLYATIEPCSMCAGACVLARVKKIIYGAEDPKSGACGSVLDIANNKKLNHRIEVISGILREDSAFLVKEFFKKKR